MNKRPLAIFVIGSIVLLVVLIALSTGASLFLGEVPVVSSDKVALIKIEGVIMQSEDVIKQIKKYSKNPSIKAIVFRIDSPGGAVVPSQEIYEEIKKVRDRKDKDRPKIIVSMGTVAASGGYYIASAADKIVANSGTLTGSIGVIMEFASVEELIKKIGVKSETIASGPRKDVGNVMRSMTPEEKVYLHGVISDVYEQFVEAIAAGRPKLTKEKIYPLADGSIYTGRQALALGLVDELGDQEDAINTAARMAGIEGEPTVVEDQKNVTFLDVLSGKDVNNLFKGLLGQNSGGLMYLYAAPSVK